MLKGFTIERFKPKLVIIELHEQGQVERNFRHEFQGPALDFANEYFPAAGYEKIYADYINTIFRLK